MRKKLEVSEGETVEQATVVQPSESSSPDSAPGQPGEIAARIPRAYGYLIVTDRRFLWSTYTGTGSAGDIEAELAYHEVVSVDLRDGATSSKLLTLAFIDGSEIGLVIAGNQKPGRLVTAMQARLG